MTHSTIEVFPESMIKKLEFATITERKKLYSFTVVRRCNAESESCALLLDGASQGRRLRVSFVTVSTFHPAIVPRRG